jgi:hypothetical protein
LHRASWAVYRGRIPNGLLVLHRCDNERCANPDHLFLGTNKDNTRDMMRKGRLNPPRGERAGNAKLTADQVRAIRTDPRSLRLTAMAYGVSGAAIQSIRSRRNWAHIDGGKAEK